MANVTVLDYGTSNLRSVAKALESVTEAGTRVLITDKAADLRRADRVVFPGQGAIGQCMDSLHRLELVEAVSRCIGERPYLGICLGLQSLLQTSAENDGTPCLGIVPGSVVRFPHDLRDANGERLKIPHMGWNQVYQSAAHALWSGIGEGEYFYFVHSYYVAPDADADIAGSTDYGIRFCSALARDNLFAVQFHPEKSQAPGLSLLRNFLNWSP